MLTFNRVKLKNFDEQDLIVRQLYTIFSRTLKKSMSFKEFRIYYCFHQPLFVDVTFIMHGEETVGFISTAFYKHDLGGKAYTICKGAVGVLENFRRGAVTGWQLCLKYIRYKCMHPEEDVYLVAFITNPIMYAMICKYAHHVYPRQGIELPLMVERFKDDLIAHYKLKKNQLSPFVVKLHFHVPLNETELRRIHASQDKDLRFYLSLNNNFQDRAGLVTLIPVNWYNLFFSVIKVLIVRPVKKYSRKLNFRTLFHFKSHGYGIASGTGISKPFVERNL